jgi:hypothetical protein
MVIIRIVVVPTFASGFSPGGTTELSRKLIYFHDHHSLVQQSRMKTRNRRFLTAMPDGSGQKPSQT